MEQIQITRNQVYSLQLNLNVTLIPNESGDLNISHGGGRMWQYVEFRVSKYMWKYIAPVILLLGTIGSVLSLLVLCRKSMRSQTTMFYMSALAVADLMVLYAGLVRLWLEHAEDIYIRLTSSTACRLHNFLVYLSLDLSVWILVAVSIDRCLYVSWPASARKWCTIVNARIFVVIIFCMSALVNVHFFWTYNLELHGSQQIYANGNKKCYANTASSLAVSFVENIWPWIDFCVYCLLPFLFMATSNAIIIKQLIRNDRNMASYQNVVLDRVRQSILEKSQVERHPLTVTPMSEQYCGQKSKGKSNKVVRQFGSMVELTDNDFSETREAEDGAYQQEIVREDALQDDSGDDQEKCIAVRPQQTTFTTVSEESNFSFNLDVASAEIRGVHQNDTDSSLIELQHCRTHDVINIKTEKCNRCPVCLSKTLLINKNSEIVIAGTILITQDYQHKRTDNNSAAECQQSLNRSTNCIKTEIPTDIKKNNLSTSDLSTKVISSKIVSTTMISTAGISMAGISTAGLSSTGISTKEIASSGVSTTEIKKNGIPTKGLTTTGISKNGISKIGVSTTGISKSGISSTGISKNGISSTGVSTIGISKNEIPTKGVSKLCVGFECGRESHCVGFDSEAITQLRPVTEQANIGKASCSVPSFRQSPYNSNGIAQKMAYPNDFRIDYQTNDASIADSVSSTFPKTLNIVQDSDTPIQMDLGTSLYHELMCQKSSNRNQICQMSSNTKLACQNSDTKLLYHRSSNKNTCQRPSNNISNQQHLCNVHCRRDNSSTGSNNSRFKSTTTTAPCLKMYNCKFREDNSAIISDQTNQNENYSNHDFSRVSHSRIRELGITLGGSTSSPTNKWRNANLVNTERQISTSSRRSTSSVSNTLLAITIMFWVFNAPIVIFIICHTYFVTSANDHAQAVIILGWTIVNILQYMNNALHFFLYCLTGPKFRHELRDMFSQFIAVVKR